MDIKAAVAAYFTNYVKGQTAFSGRTTNSLNSDGTTYKYNYILLEGSPKTVPLPGLDFCLLRLGY